MDRPHARRVGGLAVAMLAAVLAPAAQPAVREAPGLQLHRCRLVHPLGLGSVAARCGKLSVAENPADPAGRHIELAVAVIPAIAADAKPDPLFLLAGGPGQGAREAYTPMLGAFAGIRRDRDLVLVDQRGTGDSNPTAVAAAGEAFADIARLGFDKAMTRWNAKAREDGKQGKTPPESPGGNILLAPGASSGGSISRKEARSQDDTEEV
ncbi:MAG: hypothetical protein C3F14_12315 [Deltaproteobacteria bacterium]|nr:MAG: hypothetical protein C3F14_12315 [Deltaproteobacteria bacterium]